MAWNEPGGGNRDPWNPKGRGGGNNGGGGNGGIPEVDRLLENLRARFRRGGRPGGISGGGMGLLALAALLVWGVLCFFAVDAQERAVVLRFGAYVRSNGPGWGWRAWPIESVEKVNVTQVRQVTERSDMLTLDENIVDVELKVQYRVSDIEKYLFSQSDPDATLRQITKAAVREVVGRSQMDFILIEGRQQVAENTQQILQERLDAYDSGLIVTEVNLQNVQAPEAVQDAFADAIKAREDRERLKNEAEAYANDRLPRARGAAARELAEAIAYRARLIAQAEGESARFTKVLVEYRKAPRVTRDRLYLEMMSEVLANTSKVVVDSKRNGQMMVLPLDALMRSRTGDGSQDAAAPAGAGKSGGAAGDNRSRERGGR